jgi:hypothetical protein
MKKPSSSERKRNARRYMGSRAKDRAPRQARIAGLLEEMDGAAVELGEDETWVKECLEKCLIEKDRLKEAEEMGGGTRDRNAEVRL